MISVYSKPNCPACIQAAMILKAKCVTHTVHKLDEDYTLDYLTEILAAVGQPPARSFPQFFKNDDKDYIGGFHELKNKLSQGLL
jgi:glutaredoxin